MLQLLFTDFWTFLALIIAYIVSTIFVGIGVLFIGQMYGFSSYRMIPFRLFPQDFFDFFGVLFFISTGYSWGKTNIEIFFHFSSSFQRVLVGFLFIGGHFLLGLFSFLLFHFTPDFLQNFLQIFFEFQMILCAFHLLPFRPLGGYFLLSAIIPFALREKWNLIQEHSPFFLFLFFLFPLFLGFPVMQMIIEFFSSFFIWGIFFFSTPFVLM